MVGCSGSGWVGSHGKRELREKMGKKGEKTKQKIGTINFKIIISNGSKTFFNTLAFTHC